MAQIINLKTFRKDKARAQARATGDANAAKFGRTKIEKSLDEARKKKAAQILDGHKREE